MRFIQSQEISGSRIPTDGMYVGTKSGDSSQESSWKLVFGDEARKINPLFDVKVKRDELIISSIQNNDWSEYNKFEAAQHPAWYEEVNGEYQPNKMYYGNLIESKINALKEAKAENDSEKIEIWSKNLKEAIINFNNAPGIVPYIVGLNHNEQTAAENGVPEPGDDFFDSKWNSSIVADQGKFEQNMWYDNAYLAQNQDLKQHVETLVAGTFPTSWELNEGITVVNASDDFSKLKGNDSAEKTEEVEQLAKTASTNTDTDETSLQSVLLHNLKFAFKPSLNVVEALYK
ncbi:hypothetical protein [Ureibacillus sp. GCM10028918]|uniref:hypothetical protein n=1 Tax=Ureibacillus sp. GCM10028918 TaxID=3273429 RepID=UPI003611585D